MENLATLAQDMEADITLWDKQFPFLPYVTTTDPAVLAERHLMGKIGRLPVVYDPGSVRRQAGPYPWDRWIFTGTFATIWNGLRDYLSMPVDRGLLTEEGRAALATMQSAEAKTRAARAARVTTTISAGPGPSRGPGRGGMAAKSRHRRRQGSLSQLQSALWAAVSEATGMIEAPRSPKYLKLRAISALSTAAGVYIKLLEVSDMEKRLTRIEALLAERNGHHVS